MKLLIISHTPHYLSSSAFSGWGPTVREINALSTLFEQIVHVAPLHDGVAPQTALPYASSRITLRPVPFSGGNGVGKKLEILKCIPKYLEVFRDEFKSADFVHIRCPSGISLIALLALTLFNGPSYRWIKYAGNWKPEEKTPLSFAFQRFWLERNLHRGAVMINGKWPAQPRHIYSFDNPCLTEEELDTASAAASGKELGRSVSLLFAGEINASKGLARILNISEKLKNSGVLFDFHIAGDGRERRFFEAQAASRGLSDHLHFYGWLNREKLVKLYEHAHYMVLPSDSEGWPKVLSESMAYGVVPLAGAVSCIPQILRETGVGAAFSPDDTENFAGVIQAGTLKPYEWKKQSEAAVKAAVRFSYQQYLIRLQKLFFEIWKIAL